MMNGALIDGVCAGARIWMGRVTEEIRGGTGPYVVAQHPRPSLTLPVMSITKMKNSLL